MDLIEFRRDLHRHPEVGFDVGRTAGKIADVFDAAGIEVARDVGGGVVASLRRGDGTRPGIGLRADMDALPIDEGVAGPWASVNAGRFHGCGHDGHSAMLVGAALALARDTALDRDVHFIFQPDEENGNGARAMIAAGLFERFEIGEIYGMHNMPGLEVGQFATQAGPFCAFEANFEIRIAGKGGHASMPEVGVDAIVVGAAVVGALQNIVSRGVSATSHAVVSVTEFTSDGARNILASNAVLRGDCRGFSNTVRARIETRMRDIVAGICAAHGATGAVDFATSFVPLVNDAEATARVVAAAEAVGTVDASYGRVGFSEDFAAFLEHCKGAFILSGNGTEGRYAMPLHNPQYDFNETAIAPGVEFWCALARG